MSEKRTGKAGRIIWTVAASLLAVIALILMIAANTALKQNSRIVNNIMGSNSRKYLDNSKAQTAGLDLAYYKADYTKETMPQAEDSLKQRISAEGAVLLKNSTENGAVLPIPQGSTLSFFSVNSVKYSEGGSILGGGGKSLKDSLTADGLKVNETLWKFYTDGTGKGYGLASGSISYGDSEDFRINECPLSVLQKDSAVLKSTEGTIPVYFLKRVAGEGRDMPRSMYNHAAGSEDKARSYLEPDSTELEILSYLNSSFSSVILVVNSNAALELGWVSQFRNIKAVLYMPSGFYALGGILTGKINPSGRTVDTFAAHALNSPAAQNFGDYQYFNADGTASKYNYVSYREGIYVGYRYYETRYEDSVLGQGNAGDFSYSNEVVYPFGYGLSYTTFSWTDFSAVWNGDTCTVSVNVTNTGDKAGKDVVEVYIQSPYTAYDKANRVEKPSVQLAGYAKTAELEPGASQKVTVTFSRRQLASYDYTNAKTFIFDAGTYYITAAANAHAAVNNILAAKGVAGTSSGSTAALSALSASGAASHTAGLASLAAAYIPENTDTDTVTYSTDSYSGVKITNQLDEANGGLSCLSRSDWTATWPSHDGTASSQISTWGNEINGKDSAGKDASYTWGKEISADLLAKLDSFDSLNPEDTAAFTDKIVYGAHNHLTLADMRGLDYDDPKWQALLDELTPEEYYELIGISGYGIPFTKSVNKPFCLDADTANGLFYGGTGVMYPNMMTLAQTWNKDLALEYGTMIGNQALMGGADGWYAPSMNIHRTPFSGRNGEYYSEDPFISGTVASNEIYGAASKGLYAYIKHFAFNDQENHRGDRDGQFSVATWLNEQSAREIYLVPFEMCMKCGDVDMNYVMQNADGSWKNTTRKIRAAQAVMTSFNRVGYTWAGASYPLLTGILRHEWAFNGLVMTDNANTGVFMDCGQMIAAGGDVKLTSLPASARFNYNKNDVATYHYGRTAIHHLMYTAANSKVMNGAMSGSIFRNPMSTGQKIRLAANIACPIVILLLAASVALMYIKGRKTKKQER